MTDVTDARQLRTVTADGRVVIPYAIQQALGVEFGGQVTFNVEHGVVTIRPSGITQVMEQAKDRPAATVGWADIKAELNALLEAASRNRVTEPEKILE